ncbi:MAG: oligosaccharide flippase family protein [Bacteroidales bacterium]|nr:oligosaccharide flippase family protein [Bacteroidales bacterium]
MQSLQQKLFSGLFWVLLLNLLVKPFWILGIEVGVQNAVGAEAYGFYFAIFNLAYIFNILLDLGITNYNTRNIARHPQLLDKHLSAILTTKLLLLALYIVITFSAGLLLGYTSRQFILLAALCFNQFLNSLILYLRSNFEALLLFRWDSVLSVIDRILMIVICGILLLYSSGCNVDFRIEWFVAAQSAAYLLTAIAAFAVLLRHSRMRRLHFDRAFTLVLLRQSLPYALLVLLMASYNRIDPILLSHLDGDTSAGVYAGAFRLLDALTMVAYLVSVPLLPVFARLTRIPVATSDHQLAHTTRATFSLLIAFAIAAAIVLSTLADPLMTLMYSDHAKASSEVFRVLIYGIIPLSFTYIFGTLLTAGGHLRQLNLMALGTLVVNIVINLWLIPRYGAVGSAWASLIAQSFMAIAQLWLALHIYRLRPSWQYLLVLAAYTSSIVVGSLLCDLLGWEWWQQLMVLTAFAVVMAFGLRLIDLRQLLRLLRKEGA